MPIKKGGGSVSDDVLLFFDGHMDALPIYERLEGEVMRLFPDTKIEVRKTQISFKNRHLFACASFLPVRRKVERPNPFLTVTFGLGRAVYDGRIAVTVEAAPNRWTHHVLVGSPEEIDGALMAWIGEAYRFAEGKR